MNSTESYSKPVKYSRHKYFQKICPSAKDLGIIAVVKNIVFTTKASIIVMHSNDFVKCYLNIV